MPIIEGTTVKIEEVKYIDILVGNNFQINTKEIGADRKLRRTNSYFQFAVDPELFIQETVEEAEEIGTKKRTKESIDKTFKKITNLKVKGLDNVELLYSEKYSY